MANLKYPNSFWLGAYSITNPRVFYITTIKPIIDRLNGVTAVDSMSFSGQIASTATTESSSAITGAIVSTGGLGISKNATIGGLTVIKKATVNASTAVACNTTGAATLAVVNSGLVAGLISSTSAAAVTITLDSVANITAAFLAAGVTIGPGTTIQFVVDNTAGANTVTVAVDAGVTIELPTPAITGGETLTVSTANKIGVFNLYLGLNNKGVLSRAI